MTSCRKKPKNNIIFFHFAKFSAKDTNTDVMVFRLSLTQLFIASFGEINSQKLAIMSGPLGFEIFFMFSSYKDIRLFC